MCPSTPRLSCSHKASTTRRPTRSCASSKWTGDATSRALLTFIVPLWRRLCLVIASGTGRVAAFVGVAVFSALAVAALKTGHPYGSFLVVLAIVAPLAGLLHWLESWKAHEMAYELLAEMRIALFRKLDALAPAYLLRRRSGDLVGLATQDVETVEYFYAHTVAPALIAIAVPAAVLIALADFAWQTALVLLPFLLLAGLVPVLVRGRIDRLGARAREGLGRLNAHITDTIQGLADLVAFQAVARRRAEFMRLRARLSRAASRRSSAISRPSRRSSRRRSALAGSASR